MRTVWARLLFIDLILFMSPGPREKNATSDPDINADPSRRIIRIINPVRILGSVNARLVPEKRLIYDRKGSGSNCFLFSSTRRADHLRSCPVKGYHRKDNWSLAHLQSLMTLEILFRCWLYFDWKLIYLILSYSSLHCHYH
jgi:hypothetical protein